MEIDHHHHLKSGSPEDDHQMEMMLMMDKIPPEFYNEITDLTSPPPHHDIPTYNTISHFLENNNNNNQLLPFINHLSSSPTPPPLQPPHFLSNNYPAGAAGGNHHQKSRNSMAAMREMIFRIAAMQPIHIDPESVKPPKRRNVKISKDPQSVAARHRRERISERIRILQRLVPGGTKMDTASMLDEAIHYVKFLKTQVQSLERAQANRPTGTAAPPPPPPGIGFPVAMSSGSYLAPLGNHTNHHHHHHNQNVQNYGDAN